MGRCNGGERRTLLNRTEKDINTKWEVTGQIGSLMKRQGKLGAEKSGAESGRELLSLYDMIEGDMAPD